MKFRIFIGSSKERLAVANAVRRGLEDTHEPTVWTDGIFSLSKDILSGLLATLDTSEAAVFILAPDDLTRIRDQQHTTVRDNVIFELGLFMGRLGRERTFFVVPKGIKELHLPSDLTGVIYACYDPDRIEGNPNGAVATACDEIKRAISDSMATLAKRQIDSRSAFNRAFAAASFGARMEKVLLRILGEGSDPALAQTNSDSTNDVLRWEDGRHVVRVIFGRIEESPTGNDHLVALPANDLFDPHCFDDSKGAMGSCMHKWFAGRVDKIQSLVHQQLAQEVHRMIATPVATSEAQLSLSYGTGKCIYLDQPLGVDRRIAIVSTSIKRANVGLHSEGAYVFAALREVCHVMNDEKLDTVYLPVFGGGKGTMHPAIAFWYLLLALRSLFDEAIGGGRGLRSVHIIVFRGAPTSKPEIEPQLAGKLLALAMR